MHEKRGLWAEHGQAFRDALRPGTVLETYDCGYITVNSVTADGVLADTIYERDHLWTWADLLRYECLLYYQPKEGELPMRTVGKLRKRSGIIPADPRAKADFEPGMTEEQLIALELGRALAAEGFTEGVFRAYCRHPNGAWTCVAGPHGGGLVDHAAMRPHLDALVGKFRTTGMAPMVEMTLTYLARTPEARYSVEYRYEGE